MSNLKLIQLLMPPALLLCFNLANAQHYCKLTDAEMPRMLEPPAGRIDVVFDTDTYNVIDDQFALVYAFLLSQDKLNLKAVYAAPFSNDLVRLMEWSKVMKSFYGY